MTETKEQLLQFMQEMNKRFNHIERMLDEVRAEMREPLNQMRVLVQTLADKAKGYSDNTLPPSRKKFS